MHCVIYVYNKSFFTFLIWSDPKRGTWNNLKSTIDIILINKKDTFWHSGKNIIVKRRNNMESLRVDF